MFASIGIDVGTTACRTAYLAGEEPRIILNRRDRPDTPSYVGIAANGQVVVGAEAEALDAPPMAGLKQMLGSQRRVWFGGVMRSPTELVALLLQALKQDAERRLGQTVESAVVSVPAHAGNLHRVALRQATTAVGLRSVRLINEPTAAALSCISQQDSPRRVLVYMLGAGAFEAVILEVEERRFKSLAVVGQEGIGGNAFDIQLSEYILNRLEDAQASAPVERDADLLFRTRRCVEAAKVRLSETTQTIVTLEQKVSGDRLAQFEVPLSRGELSAVLRPFVAATMRVVQKMLDDAQLTTADIDDVLLVGGSTRLPLVQESISDLTRKEFALAPLDSVVRGAALQTVALDEPAQAEATPAAPPPNKPPPPQVTRVASPFAIALSTPKPNPPDSAQRLPTTSLAECLDWLERGEFDRAIDGLRALYQRQATPEVSHCLITAYHRKGLKLQQARKWQQAETTLAEALMYNPTDAATRHLLGQICLTWGNKLIENGDRQQGQQILQRGLGYDPSHAELANRLQQLKAARSTNPTDKRKRNARR